MTSIFLGVSLLMLAIAVLFAVWPMLRSHNHASHTSHSSPEINLAIHKARLQELEADKANGLLSESAYEEAYAEIGQNILQAKQQDAEFLQTKPPLIYLVAITGFIFLFTLLCYGYWGSFYPLQEANFAIDKPNPQADTRRDDTKHEITALRERVATNPNDAEGWFLLGRALVEISHYKEALAAYEKVRQIVGDDPVVLAEFIQTSYIVHQTITAEMTALSNKVLATYPGHPLIMSIYGIDAFKTKQYEKAINYWQTALKQLEPGSEQHKHLSAVIKNAQTKLGNVVGQQSNTMNKPEGITVLVEISDEMKQRLSGSDTLFVFARAVEGPRMPLAIHKQAVRINEFPIKVFLSDDDAMTQKFRLSQFDRIIIGARVSASGNAMAKPGDIQGYSAIIPFDGTETVSQTVVIDHVVQ